MPPERERLKRVCDSCWSLGRLSAAAWVKGEGASLLGLCDEHARAMSEAHASRRRGAGA